MKLTVLLPLAIHWLSKNWKLANKIIGIVSPDAVPSLDKIVQELEGASEPKEVPIVDTSLKPEVFRQADEAQPSHPARVKHINSGKCPKCIEIIERYPGFDQSLWGWFEAKQAECPDAHVSCAGRGKAEQEKHFAQGASKAHWKQSSHNYNAALDVFRLRDGRTLEYSRDWYEAKVANNLPDTVEWYGKPGAKFPELPHFELKGWRQQISNGSLKLVESE